MLCLSSCVVFGVIYEIRKINIKNKTKLQSSGRNAPITVVFCNDVTSVMPEVTDQRTVVKLVLGWIFGGYSLGSSRDFTEVRGTSKWG